MSLAEAGFSELGLSLPIPWKMDLLTSVVVQLAVDKRSVFLELGFVYGLPPCIEAFLGLPETQTPGSSGELRPTP